ncbi:MAG: BamA/TamA family outer membrane protein [Spirochaetota bacterium]
MRQGILISVFIIILPFSAVSAADVLPVPVVAYSGDTSVMLGGALFIFPDSENGQRRDSIRFLGIYTLKNQMITSAGYRKFFADGFLYNSGSAGYVNFPNDFYGIGPGTPGSNREEYTPVTVPVRQSLMFKVLPYTYAGPFYTFIYADIRDTTKGGLLEQDPVPDAGGGIVSMPGLTVEYDTRNDEFYPSEGAFFEGAVMANSVSMGATSESQKAELDYRHFFNLYHHDYILGVQANVVYQRGEVPLVLLESVGGASLVRGYDGGRYLDKSRYGVQGEFRHPYRFLEKYGILRRFSGTVFGGLGSVADTPFDFQRKYAYWAAGMGLRFRISNGNRIHVRADYAVNRYGESFFYFNFTEAF